MNVIIIHGWADDENDNPLPPWMLWVKKELSNKKINCLTPLMPESWKPDYGNWKEEFDKLMVNKETILIGHSCGCAFLVRWLGETKKKIKKLILVAPWKIADKDEPELFEIKKKFYDFDVNPSIKKNISEIIIFTSNNEEEDGKRSARIFNKYLGGKLIELKKHGHYTFEDMKTEKFSELLEEVLKC